MPRHWKQPREEDPWIGARTWAAGQAVQLRESLRQLARRAQSPAWPEYAELECYSCHHNLTPPEQSWRQQRGYPGRRPGAPPWNAASYAVFRNLARQLDRDAAAELESDIEKLGRLVGQASADPNEIAATASRAAQTADRVAQRVRTLPFNAALTFGLLRSICADAERIAGLGEQSAEQAALSLDSLFVAYARAARPENEKDVRAAIDGLFEQLQNPSAYQPDEFARQMRRVGAALSSPAGSP